MTILNKVASELTTTVLKTKTWLVELDEETVRHKPTPDRWSIAEVVGHLIDSACNNHQRFIRAQRVDEFTFPKYEQNHWVALNHYHASDWTLMVDLWSNYNLHLAHVIRNIPEPELRTPCTITPYDTCSLEHLVTDYLDHLNHHLTKIHERLART